MHHLHLMASVTCACISTTRLKFIEPLDDTLLISKFVNNCHIRQSASFVLRADFPPAVWTQRERQYRQDTKSTVQR